MISIIIPTFNSAKYIATCVESIINQRYDNFEIIIIDDGSDDETKQTLKQLNSQYNKIQVFYQLHSGVSAARNLGLTKATGDYITFIDSDDTLAVECLQTVMEQVEKEPYDLVVYGIQNLIHTNGIIINGETWALQDKIFISSGALADEYIRQGGMLMYSNCNKFYRNDLINRYQIKFEQQVNFGEDRLFNWDYLKYCNSIRTLDHCLYQYHHRKRDSLSKKFISGLMLQLLKLHKEKVHCMFLLRETSSKQDWEVFAYNDIMQEIIKALNHLANQYYWLSKQNRQQEIEILLHQKLPAYFYSYSSQIKAKRKILHMIIEKKQTWCVHLYCWLFLIRKKLKNER